MAGDELEMDSDWLMWLALVGFMAAPLAWALTWRKANGREPPSRDDFIN